MPVVNDRAGERRSRPARPTWAGALGLVAALGLLLAEVVPDVGRKPLFEDEAVAGLIAARPLPELLGTVLGDRGGAPLHFVLAHFAFVFDSSASALRWLSVALALGAVIATYDLGRRLGGETAAIVAALVAATSTMLGVYGSFGRMYSLLAFTSAIALDLFVRALDKRTLRAALAAAVAAWFVPAAHPYGLILVGAEALVALAVWRGRPLRPGLAVAAVGLALVPLALADLRLADRFTVGVEGDASLAQPADAWSQLARALAAFAGGSGPLFVLFLVLGGVGLLELLRRHAAVAALALLSLLAPSLLFMVLATGRGDSLEGLSPRHLVFALPLWASLVGVCVASPPRRASPLLALAAIAAVAVSAALAPSGGVRDPRDLAQNLTLGGGSEPRAIGAREAVEAPAAWLRESVTERGLLFPFSAVYLAALPETGAATALPRSEPGLLVRALRRADLPASGLVVAVPLGKQRVDAGRLRSLLPSSRPIEIGVFRRWLLVEVDGPLADPPSVLRELLQVLRATDASLEAPVEEQVSFYVRFGASVACGSLRLLERSCATEGG